MSSANAQSRPVFLEQNKQKTDLQRLLRYALTILPIHSSNDDAEAGEAEAGRRSKRRMNLKRKVIMIIII